MLAVGTVSMLTCGEVGHPADSLQGHPTSAAQGGIDHRHMEPGHCDPHLPDPTQAAINLGKITGPLKRELRGSRGAALSPNTQSISHFCRD